MTVSAEAQPRPETPAAAGPRLAPVADAWAGWPLHGQGASVAPDRNRPGTPNCYVEGWKGKTVRAELLEVDPMLQRLLLRARPGGGPVPLRFDQIRCLTLVTRSGSGPSDAPPPAARLAPFVRYRIQFSAANEVCGLAEHVAETAHGLLLRDGGERRVFYPRSAYAHAALGDDADVAEARLVLQAQHVVSPDQLGAAIEASAQLSMMRIGVTLLALGHIDQAQLAAGLQAQRQQPDLPLGELLLAAGTITAQQHQQALEHKRGHPIIDVDRFPVSAQALGLLPAADARLLDALPVWLDDQRVVVVTRDPARHDLDKLLGFRLGRPVLLATPAMGPMERLIDLHHGPAEEPEAA